MHRFSRGEEIMRELEARIDKVEKNVDEVMLENRELDVRMSNLEKLEGGKDGRTNTKANN